MDNHGDQKSSNPQIDIDCDNNSTRNREDLEGAGHSNLLEQVLRCSKSIERDLSNRFRKKFQQSLSRFDLLSRLHRLSVIQTQGDWIPIGQIASQLMSSNGNITGLVDRMVTEGLINRRDNRNDRRSVEISLTEKGAGLYNEMHHAYTGWSETLLSEHLHTIDREQFNKAALPNTQ